MQDKDPSVAWLQDPMCMMSRWYHMLKSASSRWQLLDLRKSDVLKIYRSSINDCLPRFILRDATIHYENLPVVYPTIKKNALLVSLMFSTLQIVPLLTCQVAHVKNHHIHVSETLCLLPQCQGPDNSALSVVLSGT